MRPPEPTIPQVELTLHVHRDTGQALLASLDGSPEHAQWLPMSALHIVGRGGLGRLFIVRMNKGLAERKGLVGVAGAGQGRLL